MNRIQIQILLGTLMVLGVSAILLVWGFREEERMGKYEVAFEARSIERGAELFSSQCSRCHGTDGTGIIGLCPPLNDKNFFENRLTEVGWSGSMADYIVATVSSGRLVSTRAELYPGESTRPNSPAMPSFAQNYGGPLREDQIRDIAAFIINWSATAQAIEPPTAPTGPLAGTDITKVLPEGNAANGEALATSLGCTACHAIQGGAGPYWPASGDQAGIGDRAGTRITQSDYTGAAETAEQYLFESVVNTSIYLVAGYGDGLMPKTYGSTLTEQDMADLIAYLLTIK